jgi:hypothetical protein
MFRTALVAVVCLALPAVAQGEFVVKYIIDGHVVAPPAGGSLQGSAATNWIAEMDGDPSSPEMVAGELYQVGTPAYRFIGIVHLMTGVVEWVDIPNGRDFFVVGRDGSDSWHFTGPVFYDVDADGLADVLVPYRNTTSGLETAVIGWNGAARVDGAEDLGSHLSAPRATPNPAPRSVSIEFSLPRDADVELSIYDVTGRLVRSLIAEPLDAGDYTVSWNGRDESGRGVAAGSYFYQLDVGGVQQSRRVLLIR